MPVKNIKEKFIYITKRKFADDPEFNFDKY